MLNVVTDDISAVTQAIADRIGQHRYRVWFKNSTRFSLADDYLKIGVPNPFVGSWIENHFLAEICDAVKTVTGSEKKISFNIDPELAGNLRRNQLDSQAQSVDKTQNRSVRSRPASLLNSEKPLKLSFDSFVVGPSNELAYNAARAVVTEKVSPFSPLFIHGGYGLGKTHLLQGICNELSTIRPEVKWLYVSAEDFANQYVLALKTKKLETFRKRFRQTDLLAIDDVHFLASKPSMQEEFLHTFNTIDLAGKQVILASDAHPKMIGQLCERLVSRFVAGMVVKIEPPDFKTRCKICGQRAKTLDRDISDDVIEYVAENLRTNVRELEGALLKLVAFASLSNQKVTLAVARQVLAEHISRTDPIVHISDIEASVTAFFGVTTADVHSTKKDRTVSTARSFSMYLARKYTKMSYPEIGRLMGQKNHATVILACRKVEDLLSGNKTVCWRTNVGPRAVGAKDILSQVETNIAY